ncbi:MAG: DUF1819 family protein [Verrucomicrobiae bacterium]|nr:DUF1819 family protein [Verrucomicrobiae bacterium]
MRPELAGVIAELYFEHGSWEKTRDVVLETNALQCRSSASGKRIERELRPRLETLTPAELALLHTGTLETRIALSWLAAVKRHPFLHDVASELLRSKLDLHDAVLRTSDYETFVEEKAVRHPELETLSELTRGKVRRVLLRMLREVGILVKGPDLGAVARPIIPPEVEDAIRADNPRWLSAFLVPEAQI